jgi:hypothetical protein
MRLAEGQVRIVLAGGAQGAWPVSDPDREKGNRAMQAMMRQKIIIAEFDKAFAG